MADNTGKFLFGFWLGALAGAAAGFLLAPRSGEETVRQLQEKGIELKGQLQTQAQQAAEQARLQAQQVAEQARLQAQQVADQARLQAQQAEERGRTALAEGVRKTQQAVDAAQQRLAKPGEDSGPIVI